MQYVKSTMLAVLIFLWACELDEGGSDPAYYVRYHLEGTTSTVNVSYRTPEGTTVYRPGVPGNQVIDVSEGSTLSYGGACSVVGVSAVNVSNDGTVRVIVEVNRKRSYSAETDVADGTAEITQYVDPLHCGY